MLSGRALSISVLDQNRSHGAKTLSCTLSMPKHLTLSKELSFFVRIDVKCRYVPLSCAPFSPKKFTRGSTVERLKQTIISKAVHVYRTDYQDTLTFTHMQYFFLFILGQGLSFFLNRTLGSIIFYSIPYCAILSQSKLIPQRTNNI